MQSRDDREEIVARRILGEAKELGAEPNGRGGTDQPHEEDPDELDEAAVKQRQERQIEAGKHRLAELIARFNARYGVVNEAGKAVIYEQRTDPLLERKVLIRIEFEALKKFYMNDCVAIAFPKPQKKPGINTVTRTAAEWWLTHEQRR